MTQFNLCSGNTAILHKKQNCASPSCPHVSFILSPQPWSNLASPVCFPSYLPLLTLHSPLGLFHHFSKLQLSLQYRKKLVQNLSNYYNLCPISNLPFISKILTQLLSHLTQISLYELFQSGFHSLHSMQAALIKITSNVLIAADCLSFHPHLS